MLLNLKHNQNIEATIIIVKIKDVTAVIIIPELSETDSSLSSSSKQPSSSKQVGQLTVPSSNNSVSIQPVFPEGKQDANGLYE